MKSLPSERHKFPQLYVCQILTARDAADFSERSIEVAIGNVTENYFMTMKGKQMGNPVAHLLAPMTPTVLIIHPPRYVTASD